MAIVIRGATQCALCREILAVGQRLTAFPHFLPKGHEFWRFSDAAFHRSCWEAFPEAPRMNALYERWDKVLKAVCTEGRRRGVKTGDQLREFEQWASTVFAKLHEEDGFRMSSEEGTV